MYCGPVIHPCTRVTSHHNKINGENCSKAREWDCLEMATYKKIYEHRVEGNEKRSRPNMCLWKGSIPGTGNSK